METAASEGPLLRARKAIAAGRLDVASALVGEHRTAGGDEAELLHLEGLIARHSGDIARAEDLLGKAVAAAPDSQALLIDWTNLLFEMGRFEEAERALAEALARDPHNRRLRIALGLLKREADDRDASAAIFDELLEAAPTDAYLLGARARIELERGGDARPLYARAMRAAPADATLRLGSAAAHYQRGDAGEAIHLLASAVRTQPGWTEGLHTLARMRWQSGLGSPEEEYRVATAARPQDVMLWATFAGNVAGTKGHEAALAIVAEARAAAGDHALFRMMEAEYLSESGRLEEAGAAFARLGEVADPSFAPARLRFLLRAGRWREAASLAERFVASPSQGLVWPYLGLAWRLLDDPRWAWLERYEATVGVIDLEELTPMLGDLATFLRTLHRDSRHPFDQSPRGGTQTDGALLQRTEPVIASLRHILERAIAEFACGLPPRERDHPFLAPPRERFRFTGSWSIRLAGAGFHLAHVHQQGWLSSALYVALPDFSADEDPHAGWLTLGEPPPELGLGLPPVRMVEPREGRLVLFPSTLWHGTRPFAAGERLTCAFDVVPRPA